MPWIQCSIFKVMLITRWLTHQEYSRDKGKGKIKASCKMPMSGAPPLCQELAWLSSPGRKRRKTKEQMEGWEDSTQGGRMKEDIREGEADLLTLSIAPSVECRASSGRKENFSQGEMRNQMREWQNWRQKGRKFLSPRIRHQLHRWAQTQGRPTGWESLVSELLLPHL